MWFCAADTFNPTTAVDVSTLFEVVLPSLTFNRDLQIRPICGEDYRNTSGEMRGVYRVEKNNPTSGIYLSELRSRYIGTAGSEPKVANFGHYFRFFCSIADMGSQGGVEPADGGLDNNDFIVFADLYFAMDPRADIGQTGGVPGSDSTWDNNDYIVFIDYFFAGCDPDVISCFAGGGEHMEIPAPEASAPNEDEIRRQMEALRAAYEATGDPRILDLISSLVGGP